ncbi:hypothetical protein pb186bvf_007404 [Paramecium bursaria]
MALNKGLAFVGNLAMLMYIVSFMSLYCWDLKNYKDAGGDILKFDQNSLHTYWSMQITGSCFYIVGLIASLIRIATDHMSVFYTAVGFMTIGQVFFIIGMIIGAGLSVYKDSNFNTPVNTLFALTGIFFQSILNAYEHGLEDIENDLSEKKVEKQPEDKL